MNYLDSKYSEVIFIPEPVPIYAGFLGRNVTMPCTGHQPKGNDSMVKVMWHFKCPSCGMEWLRLGHPEMLQSNKLCSDHTIEFNGGTASLSESTGALTVLNYQAAAEGLYKCHIPGGKPDVMELQSAGVCTVQTLHHTHRIMDQET